MSSEELKEIKVTKDRKYKSTGQRYRLDPIEIQCLQNLYKHFLQDAEDRQIVCNTFAEQNQHYRTVLQIAWTIHGFSAAAFFAC